MIRAKFYISGALSKLFMIALIGCCLAAALPVFALSQTSDNIPTLRLAGTGESTYKTLLKFVKDKKIDEKSKTFSFEKDTSVFKYAKQIKLLDEEKINVFEGVSGAKSSGPFWTITKDKIEAAIGRQGITKEDIELFIDYLNLVEIIIPPLSIPLIAKDSIKPTIPTFPPLQKYISLLYINEKGEKKPQDPSKWVVNIPMKKAGCTSVLISPRVLLTAAHCLDKHRKFYLTVNLEKITLECTPHPHYRPRGPWRQLDYGLCYLSRDFPRVVILRKTKEEQEKLKEDIKKDPKIATLAEEWKIATAPYERLSIDPKDLRFDFRFRRQKWILMGGYGCTERDGSGGRDDKYRAGYSRITFNHIHRLIMGSFRRADSTVLCAGDSGGAAFRLSNQFDPFGPRKVIAVNSANIIRRGKIQNISFLAKTSTPWFRHFLKQWRKKWKNPKICGVDKELDEVCHP